jgi:molybdopterin-dependent oxidoreductase alpha subunit
MWRALWRNRDELGFAWRILRDGTCDGCALGTSGMRDWTIKGTHLCTVRLELLRLNTDGPIDARVFARVDALASRTGQELRALGRLASPMVRRRGDPGFSPLSWDDALDLVGTKLRGIDPSRAAFYLTSRGLTNEAYYAAQKAARFYGSHHVDNASRLCHAASTVALKSTLGHGASTCSYRDWLGADLIVFFGANTPNNQPVTTKYLHEAKRRGAKVAVVNTVREPGFERYWIPSIASSALFGTKLADRFFSVHTGGDLAFLVGVFRALIEFGGVDEAFVRERTTGFDAARQAASHASWAALEQESGASQEDMHAFATLLMDRPNAVFVWSMGLTQHHHGVETVKALVNVGLARALVGKANAGLMPIRGHSGVQGAAEVGCVPTIDDATLTHWESVWGFSVPREIGMTATEMIDAAAMGDLDALWLVGGNPLDTMADVARSTEALHRPRLRVHQDIILNRAMLVDPSEVVVLLPATTRYEQSGGGTETSTERRIIFSPEIPGRRIAGARPEWWVFSEVMTRVRPTEAQLIRFWDAAALRREMAEAVPLYRGIETLRAKGDALQWGGPTLYADGVFAVPGGKARFSPVEPRGRTRRPDHYWVSTRRGKQFNSMVQGDVDPLVGATRHDILMCEADASHAGVHSGERVRLASPHGSFEGTVRLAPLHPGNLAVYWPEGNAILPDAAVDPASLQPDYNVQARLERIGG